MATLLFVHGTGVRDEAFDQSFAVIKSQAARHLPAFDVQGCAWGGLHGANPAKPTEAVPGYEIRPTATTSWSARRAAQRNADVRWGLLYDDPLYELRTHAALAEAAGGDDGLGGSDQSALATSPARRVLESLRGLLPSHGGVARAGHLAVELLEPALKCLAEGGVLERALQAPALQAPERVRPLIGRAFAAAWAQAADVRGLPALDGELRDSLVQDAVGRLGTPKGLKDELLGVFGAIASRVATPILRAQRSAISDAHLAATNDILLYQTAHGGQAIRGYIAQRVRDCVRDGRGPVVLLAHSLGGIACLELLVQQPGLVAGLVTCGSQAPFLVESDALAVLRRDQELPEPFPKWLNFYDLNDLLGYAAAGVFVGRVVDHEVASHQPFPESHSAYWTQESLWKRIVSFVQS